MNAAPALVPTATGGNFDLLSPDFRDIHILDIATSLSRIARWNGHTSTIRASSVAEHSVRVSWLCDAFCPEYALWGLLHDAAEAYIGDVTTPLKRQLPDYLAVEEIIETAVAERFDLPMPMPVGVKDMDDIAAAWEGRDHMTPPVITAQSDHMFLQTGTGATKLPDPWTEETARQKFLDRFTELAGDPTPDDTAQVA